MGIENGWVTSSLCYYHDGVPMSTEEIAEMEEWGEVCIPIVRLMKEGESIHDFG